MSAVVSQASIARAPHPQAGGTRSPGGAEEAESPFAALLDDCTSSEIEPADGAPEASEGAESTLPEAKLSPEKPVIAENTPVVAEGDDAEAISAELLLLIALGGQPTEAGKQEKSEDKVAQIKPTPDVIPDGPAVEETPSDVDVASIDTGETAAPVVIPPIPVPPPATVNAIPPAPAEAALQHASLPEQAALDMPAAVGSPTHPAVSAANPEKGEGPSSVETAPQGKAVVGGEEATPEKPTSAASEQTLKTPAAFRAAANTDNPPSKPELPAQANSDQPKQAGPDQPKNEAVATNAPHANIETPRADIEAPQPKPRTDSLASSQEPVANTSALPPPLPPSVGPQQITQPASVPAEPANPVPVAGLAVEIAAHAHAGKNRFEIRLDPPELGRIDVRLDVGSDGQVTSHLRVERAETLDLLRRDAPMLERALQQAGLKTSDNGLQFSLRDQSFSWQQQQQRPDTDMARLVVSDETITPAEVPRQYGRLVGLGSGVDIRV